MKSTKSDPDYFDTSPRGFACRNGMCLPTVYREMSEGRLLGRKVGRRTLITKQAEKDWLDSLPVFSGETKTKLGKGMEK